MSDSEFWLAVLVGWFCLGLAMPVLAYLVLAPWGYEVDMLFEPADLWVGAYHDREKATWYICLLPTFGVKVGLPGLQPVPESWQQWLDKSTTRLADDATEDWLNDTIKRHRTGQPAASRPQFEALLTQAIDLAFAFDRLVTASPVEYRLREHLDAEPQIDDVVLMAQGDVPDELRFGMVSSREMVRAEGTLLDATDGTSAITIKTFDGRSVSWVGGRFIRLPSEEQVISRIAEGSPLAESVGR